MHWQVPATIPNLFTQMAEIIIYYWPNIDHQATIQPGDSSNYTWIMHVDAEAMVC